MATSQLSTPVPELAPVRGKERIDVLDALRGFAILGIFYINLPAMAGPIAALFGDVRLMGWSAADQTAWVLQQTLLEGTQRGMLEMLFGAGLMVTAAKAMNADGPVGIADLYIRRNLWLLGFGLFNIFALLWPGDILHVYALCALALFPFRKLSVRWLLTLGLALAFIQVGVGAAEYVDRTEMQQVQVEAAAKLATGKKLSAEEAEAIKEWNKKLERISGQEPVVQQLNKDEQKGRAGGFADYAKFWISTYILFVGKGVLLGGVIEAFGTMLIGIALWKLGFIQGRRSARDYVVVALLAYGFGLTARYIGAFEQISFQPIPKTIWMTGELARITVSLGHIALINLIMRTAVGRKLLWPLLAAGQMAFTLYLMQQVIGIHIFYSPLGLDLPSAPGWAYLFWLASAVIAFQLLFANLWMRWFQSGPLEWIWRSLAYCRKQPFRQQRIPAEN